MYISLLMDNKVTLTLSYIVYDSQAQRGKMYPFLLMLLLFEIIWNAEDQNNEFDNPEQKTRTIRFTRIIKAFNPQ